MNIGSIKYFLEFIKIAKFKNGQLGFNDIVIIILSILGGLIALGLLIWVLHVSPQK